MSQPVLFALTEKTTSARDQVLLKPIRVEDHYHVLEEIGR